MIQLWDETDRFVCTFVASWCPPCVVIEPLMEQLEREHPAVTFAKLDIGDSLGLAGLFGVEQVPTVFFIKKGKIAKIITGLKSFEELAENTRGLQSKRGD